MTVTTTPNVQAVLRADPVMAYVIERLRLEDRPGYLHLSRPFPRSMFTAIYYDASGDRHEARCLELDDAILRAMASEVAA
jgi:hypothetical protein